MVPGSAASVAAGIWSKCSHCVPRQEAKNNVYTWFSLSLLTQSRTPEQGWCHKHSVYLSLPHLKCSKIILTYNPDTCIPGDSKLRQANHKDQLLKYCKKLYRWSCHGYHDFRVSLFSHSSDFCLGYVKALVSIHFNVLLLIVTLCIFYLNYSNLLFVIVSSMAYPSFYAMHHLQSICVTIYFRKTCGRMEQMWLCTLKIMQYLVLRLLCRRYDMIA